MEAVFFFPFSFSFFQFTPKETERRGKKKKKKKKNKKKKKIKKKKKRKKNNPKAIIIQVFFRHKPSINGVRQIITSAENKMKICRSLPNTISGHTQYIFHHVEQS